MSCEYCRQTSGYPSSCSNYEPPKPNYNCPECDENILIGKEYIVNDNCDYAYWECVDYARDLARLLGYDVKEMEGDDYQRTEDMVK